MNDTHIRVCQKSLFTGYHFEGVTVSMVVIPGMSLVKSLIFESLTRKQKNRKLLLTQFRPMFHFYTP